MGQMDLEAAGAGMNEGLEKSPRLMEPIPPIMGKNISSFPSGFRRLALANQISPYMAYYLGKVFKWFNDLFKTEDVIAAPTYEAESSPNSSITEQVLAIGLQAFLDYLQGVKLHTTDKSFDWSLQKLGDSIMECDKDTLTWTCMMLAATLPEDVDPWPWVNRALANFQITVRSGRRIDLSKIFLPVPELPELAPSSQSEKRQFSRDEGRLRYASLSMRLLAQDRSRDLGSSGDTISGPR